MTAVSPDGTWLSEPELVELERRVSTARERRAAAERDLETVGDGDDGGGAVYGAKRGAAAAHAPPPPPPP